MNSSNDHYMPLHGRHGPQRSTTLDTSLPVLQGEGVGHLAEPGALDRRRFVGVMAASLTLAGTQGCAVSQPKEEIVPHVRSPEYEIPGKPRYYATAMTQGGYATGVLVESHMGRPTRIEGNPDHPASLGAVDAITQAAILSLYDPDRSQAITHQGEFRTWASLMEELTSALSLQAQKQGAGIHILTESVTSPTLAAQLTRLRERYPEARWHQYDPLTNNNAMAGARLAFGTPVETQYRLENADVVLSLDCDFMNFGPGHVRYAHDFVQRRLLTPVDAANPEYRLNRLYVIECNYTSTGAFADHRLPLSSRDMHIAARYLAQQIGVPDVPNVEGDLTEGMRHWLDIVARDLQESRGLMVVGPWQPPEVHALGHAINAQLGSVGTTLYYTEPVMAEPVHPIDSLRELVDTAQEGEVDLLVIAGGNVAYDAPSDIAIGEAIRKARISVRLGQFHNETSKLCDWHVPAAHELEAWSDARAYDGTVSIIQPLIKPLYDGKTVHELVAVMLGEYDWTSHQIVRSYWKERLGEEGFDQKWRRILHDGVIPDTRSAEVSAVPQQLSLTSEIPAKPKLELHFRPDPSLYDGRYANNAWLQELPKPITTIVWGNAVLVSPRTAREWDLTNEQLVRLQSAGNGVELPIWVVPGHADGAVTVYLGHGRSEAGHVGNGVGTNVYPLRAADQMWYATDLTVEGLTNRLEIARTQQHHQMEGRDLFREAPWEEFRKDPHFATSHEHEVEASLYPEEVIPESDPEYAWGMSINLNACIGCNACVIACQAENNIPTVGKSGVLRAREMHWLRIDQYYVGELDNPRVFQQPVTCMHCENAPCEVVCPVEATVHSAEGLNEMVYNRCVGTRYCSNNCPYKVRRFNFLKYTDDETPVLKLLRNPDVTVRTRGVMEKCTYCVQRISSARIEAKKEGRRISDGEVVTACQSVCPTRAIEFGDTSDPNSRVAQLKSTPLDYGLLTELNTRPRTTYLARVSNPNPAM